MVVAVGPPTRPASDRSGTWPSRSSRRWPIAASASTPLARRRIDRRAGGARVIELDVPLGDRTYPVLVGAGARHRLLERAAGRRQAGRDRHPGGDRRRRRPRRRAPRLHHRRRRGRQGPRHRRGPLPRLGAVGPHPRRRRRRGRRGRGHRHRRVRRRRLPPGHPRRARAHHAARPDRRRHRRQDRREPARGQEPGRRVLAAVGGAVRHRGAGAPCRRASTAAAWARWPSTPSSASTDLADLPLDEAVAACVRCKAEVVASDEREGGRRAILNYGHTLAHALETAGALRPAPRRGGRHRPGLRRRAGPAPRPHRRRPGGRAPPGRRPPTTCRCTLPRRHRPRRAGRPVRPRQEGGRRAHVRARRPARRRARPASTTAPLLADGPGGDRDDATRRSCCCCRART